MTERIPCDFVIVRYVPDVVKGEFVNIGVILRTLPLFSLGCKIVLRFTDKWDQVLCMNSDADVNGLRHLEDDLASQLRLEHAMSAHHVTFKPILDQFFDSLSNSIQISDPQACLAESLDTELDLLMKMYVERTVTATPRTAPAGRDLILSKMRREFMNEGVWHLLKKQIGVSIYTRPGDPTKIDCGYRHGDVIRLFQAISLRSSQHSAISLAYSAAEISAGIERIEGTKLQLTAVVEPLRRTAVIDWEQEAGERYRYCLEAMEQEGVTVLSTNMLANVARTARLELIS